MEMIHDGQAPSNACGRLSDVCGVASTEFDLFWCQATLHPCQAFVLTKETP